MEVLRLTLIIIDVGMGTLDIAISYKTMGKIGHGKVNKPSIEGLTLGFVSNHSKNRTK